MSLEVFDNKRTNWEGLWYHNDTNLYSSVAFNMSQLKKFKGSVRILARKNKWYNGGENGRPNMVFTICDSKSETPYEVEVQDITDNHEERKSFTYDELEDLINRVASDFGGDGQYGNALVTDYIEWP